MATMKPGTYNIVRDWEKLQGYTDISDEYIQTRRDLNSRCVSIQNSAYRPIAVAIATYYDTPPIPNINFYLAPGQIRNVGINTPDGPLQYIHLLDPVTKKPVCWPSPLANDAQQFVIRDGLNSWYVQHFKIAGFKG